MHKESSSDLQCLSAGIVERGFNYIIAGAGCAGMSLAMHMVASGKFNDSSILLIDQDPKQSNDRTWCFWEEEEGLFEPVVFRSWEQIWFHSADFSKKLSILPYRYKMIRGIDFYNHCLKTLSAHPNVTLCFEKVDSVYSDVTGAGIIVDGQPVRGDYVFNSILFEKPALKKNDYWLLQHFKGWIIESREEVFDASTATLMDFRVNQDQGAAFCYVLPFSGKRALVEYTLFSKQLLQDEAYDTGLKDYISRVLGLDNYTILDDEFGVIPMTNHAFEGSKGRVINIGTAGGQTKGSSGYTFRFIQKHCAMIVDGIISSGNPVVPPPSSRYRFYDGIMLNVLLNDRLPGEKIFSELFKKNRPQEVLRFLDNETTIPEELKIIRSLPTLPFMKAAFHHLF